MSEKSETQWPDEEDAVNAWMEMSVELSIFEAKRGDGELSEEDHIDFQLLHKRLRSIEENLARQGITLGADHWHKFYSRFPEILHTFRIEDKELQEITEAVSREHRHKEIDILHGAMKDVIQCKIFKLLNKREHPSQV